MPRTCTVCAYEGRAEIDAALIAGESSYSIAARYSSLSRPAIERHKENHLPDRLLKARALEEISDGDRLKDELELVKEDVSRLRVKAEEEGDYRTALLGCDRALKALELQAKLLQLIQEAPTVNLYLSPEWLELRATIVAALGPHPEAREAVLSALEDRGNGRAR